MKSLIKYLAEIFKSILDGTFRLFHKHCIQCENKRIFLVSGLEGKSVRCTYCKSTLISLSSLEIIKNLDLDQEKAYVYELSYHGIVFKFLKKNFNNFFFSEFFSPENLGTKIKGIRNEDVQRLTFPSSKFDLVSSTEVFEHVEDYKLGFSEVKRVLKPGGRFVFTVPLFESKFTKQVCKTDSLGKLIWFEEPELHDSRLSGPNSVPVFWRHSRFQILDDLKDTGFSNVNLYEINFSSQISQYVVLAQC